MHPIGLSFKYLVLTPILLRFIIECKFSIRRQNAQMRHEMEPNTSFLNAFRRAVARFPAAAVVVEAPGTTLRPSAFCIVSLDPPIVALTFARCGAELPQVNFSIAALADNHECHTRLRCTLLDGKEVGDHWM